MMSILQNDSSSSVAGETMTAEQWQAFTKASLELVSIITCPTRKIAWRRGGEVLKTALKCDRIAIWAKKSYWDPEADKADQFECVFRDVASEPQPGPVAVSARDIDRDQVAITIRANSKHPMSPIVTNSFVDCDNALVLMLHDHLGRMIGAVVVPHHDGSICPFEKALADQCGRCVELGRLLYLVTRLRRKMKDAESFQSVLRLILQYAIHLLGAKRGDIGYHNWDHQDAQGRFGLIGSETDSSWKPHNLLDPAKDVWDGSKDFVDPNSFQDAGSESTLIVRVDQRFEQMTGRDKRGQSGQEPRRIALVQLKRDFGFDEVDQEHLHLLLDRAGDDFKTVGLGFDSREIVSKLVESKQLDQAGKVILESIRAAYGFDRGVIFKPNPSHAELKNFASIGLGDDANSFTHPLGGGQLDNDPSFAKHLFSDETAAFIDDVKTELELTPKSKRLGGHGVEVFKISGSLIGWRLTGIAGEPIGSMVMWRSEDVPNNPMPQSWHLEELKPMSQLASLALRAHIGEEREKTFRDAIKDVLQQMQQALDVKTNLRVIMIGLQKIGFARVRIFQYHPGGLMKGFVSLGMESLDFESRPYQASIYETDGDDYNPCIDQLIKRINQRDGDLLARLRVPKGPDHEDYDRHYAKMGKGENTPWIDIPLVIGGKFYGELAVDNLPTGRVLTEGTDVLYVSVFGALAARAFAIEGQLRMLDASSIAELYRPAHLEQTEAQLFVRLVRFLRHENGGMGFSRAIFCKATSNPGHFVYECADGESTTDESIRVSRERRDEQLSERLRDVDRTHPSSLHKSLDGYTVSVPETKPELAFRDQALHDRVQSFGPRLAVPIYSTDVLKGTVAVGLLIVDRDFGARVGEADVVALTTFAQEAGRLISFKRFYLSSMRSSADEHFTGMTRAFMYDMRSPLCNLDLNLEHLGELAVNLRGLSAIPSAELVEDVRNDLNDLLAASARARYMSVVESEPETEVDAADFFAELQKRTASRCGEARVNLTIQDPSPRLVFRGKRNSLLIALEQFVYNSCEGFESGRNSAKSSPRKVCVSLQLVQTRFEFVVQDNGPGMSKPAFERINDFPITTKNGRRWGTGLHLARRIAFLHAGNVYPENLSPGFLVRFTIEHSDSEVSHDRDRAGR
jgi:GAF domain-containing protein/signal transduction histidine kinase